MKSYKFSFANLVLPLFFLSNAAYANERLEAMEKISAKQLKLISKDKKRGEQGHRGFQGTQGPLGANGGQGGQGTPGAPGTGLLSSYFSGVTFEDDSRNENIAPGNPITFTTVNSSSNISISGGSGTTIDVTGSGFYEINFGANYFPLSTNRQSQISLLVNNVRVATSVVTSINSNNTDAPQWTPMSLIVYITTATSTIEVVNDSSSAGNIDLVNSGTQAIGPGAYITIKQLA